MGISQVSFRIAVPLTVAVVATAIPATSYALDTPSPTESTSATPTETPSQPPIAAPSTASAAPQQTPNATTPPVAENSATKQPKAAATTNRGDVRSSATQRKVVKSRLVWGFASTGADGVVRGGTVGVKSVSGRSLNAHVITKKTGKNGFFAVSRLGLPKRFVVTVTGGKVALKTGRKTKIRNSNAQLMTAVAKPKAKVRNTEADVTIGTTVAARVGMARWHNAANSKAAKLTKRTLHLPTWATLGTYDRLLKYYVSAHMIDKKAKSGRKLSQLIDQITAKAKKGKRQPTFGQGSRTKYRPYRSATRSGDRLAAGTVLEVLKGAASIAGFISTSDGTADILDALSEIENQLTQIENTLTAIQAQLTTMQDEMLSGFSDISLQLTNNQFDTLNAQNNSTAGQITAAMAQLDILINLLQNGSQLLASGSPVVLQAMISSQTITLNGVLQNIANTSVAETLQSNLIGTSLAPGLLPTLWNMIVQQRATQTPASSPAYSVTANGTTTNHALASTKLLTHENYDVFDPAASSWYLLQQELAVLTVNYRLEQTLGSSGVWTSSGGQVTLSPAAQAISDLVMNGVCSSNPQPCPGTFNSYLQVLANAFPQQSVGEREAIDTTTSMMWGNFGTANWNAVATPPAVSSPDLDMPPTVAVTCNGSQQTLRLDQDFFPTVNGTAGACTWPGAPVGGPAGSNDTATNWQILATDPTGTGGTFNATLGSLNGSGSTGLYSQVYMNNPTQNANPSQGIQGANYLDFTYPSIFPDNSTTNATVTEGWGRLAYATGNWNQFYWHGLVQNQVNPVHIPFLAFDAANPLSPDLTGIKDPLNPTNSVDALYAAPGFYVEPDGGFPFWNTNMPLNGQVTSVPVNALTDQVAGLSAPWWQELGAATYFWDGENVPHNYGPATPGCSSYAHEPSGAITVSQGCTANVIGTRPVTVSDYVWNQPTSIG